MSDIRDHVMEVTTIEDCRRIDPLLRSDLEKLDDQIRSLVARVSAKAATSGRNETLVFHATSTVLLSIAATLTGTNDSRQEGIDMGAFLARANNAAMWVNNRNQRQDLLPALLEFRL